MASTDIPTLGGGLPVLGCLPELGRDRLGLLERAYREGGELVRVPVPGRTLFVGTSPEVAADVLKREAASFVKFYGLARFSRPVLGDGLITAEGARHRRQRKLVAPALGRKEIGTYVDAMARHADALRERLAARAGAGPVDIHAEMTRLTLAIATETMFGSSAEEHARAAGAAIHAATGYIAHEVGALVHLPLSWPLPRHVRMRRAVATLDRIVADLIAERRRGENAAGDDLLGRLLAARDEDDGRAMSDEDVRDEVMTLFVAGHETTANALSWSLYLLARHPDVAERLAAEARAALDGRAPTLADLPALPYALQVFKEAMRLYPPAYMVGREATADVTVAGHAIPKGATILLSIWGLHHREDFFPVPERFDPDRFAPDREAQIPKGAYLPFADGPRVCVGNHFALIEGQVVLAHLAQHLRLDGRPGFPVPPEPRVTLRPGRKIELTVATRG
ncbi:MAG: cytochrome P450 [Deltaproteobacteria bacterium]|nr:cytochrome P450 [Deltaproteobacteria bacterium]